MSSIVSCAGCGRRNRVPTVARGVPRCAQCHAALPWLVGALPAALERWVESHLAAPAA